MEDRRFINRILISLITALSFVTMSLSGIAAFIVPQGKVAFWTDWAFLGLSKTQWGNIHITTSVLFLIAGTWHTCYNWTPLMQYLKGIPGRMAASWRDLAVAAAITTFFTVGAVTRTPPLNYILDFNSWIKESWIRTPADDPPFGHAELLSLKGFCRKMYIDTAAAEKELRLAGLAFQDANATIKQIAHANRITPARLYQIIKKLEQPETPAVAMTGKEMVADAGGKPAPAIAAAPLLYSGDMVLERFEGKGIGRKPVSAICMELQLDCTQVVQKLAAKGMQLQVGETVKEAATRLQVPPIELLKAMLVGEPVH